VIQPTGANIDFPTADFWYVGDGKIQEFNCHIGVVTMSAQPGALPDGWTRASTALWQSPAGPIDPRMPRAVTFDVDLSADTTGSAIVFLAVVMSTSNQIAAADLSLGGANQAQTGDQLVVASPHVAAKSVVLT